MARDAKKHNMNATEISFRVPSETEEGVFYRVDVELTCTCPHNSKSRRENADVDKHIFVGLKLWLAKRGWALVRLDELCGSCHSVASSPITGERVRRAA